MPQKKTVQLPMNRVEGDLEVRLDISDGMVTDAWCSGIMYRGFENILIGRGPLDGLVITPRICGICGTAHLMAAAQALEMISDVVVPPEAIRLRNLALMVEKIQSDMRHGFLFFTPDFVNPRYKDEPLFEEAVRRYTPFKGETVIQVIEHTKKIIEIIAIIGGQWPHSSYMVPGGVTAAPSSGELLQCRYLLKRFKDWYERRILGCSLERWFQVKSASDLDHWLEEEKSHRDSELGFYIRFARRIGLDKIGQGHGNFISFGLFESIRCAAATTGQATGDSRPAGFAQGDLILELNPENITEHVSHSWFTDQPGGQHPFDSDTRPYATGQESQKYSWAKAPRYNNLPAETGPLAEAIISGDPLVKSLLQRNGPNVMLRELARLIRSAELIAGMELCLMRTPEDAVFYQPPGPIPDGRGFGLLDATRGALSHWVIIEDGKIKRYQIITPTAWNASPRDANGTRGPCEEALIGTKVQDISNPVEVGHVIRSFDACLFCTVHVIDLS
ncbi:MAG: nickel-dependent hydrogenase large subunit [Deltaproteobacteria bacterium]|nr:nickel-dependent hydrogenase large subunit [Deltaproteobacteria bacterium]